jgi:2-octaprenyl-6-methoxyphenol hydroxylase
MDCDIAVVGGGPVGAALALALRESGHDITLLEPREGAASDARPIAVSQGSRELLVRLDAWPAGATPIHHIHVSQRGGFGRVHMSADELDVPALGYIVEYAELCAALDAVASPVLRLRPARALGLQRVRHEGDGWRVAYQHDGAEINLTARLVVLADGGELQGVAPAKVIDYAQTALTAIVQSELPHRHTAYERFTPEGPLALLPHGEALALVWTLPPPRAQGLLSVDDAEFLHALHEAFGGRLGRFTAVAQRATYPLALRRRGAPGAGVIAIGNAAQTLHPVAGQGFNLGLRDAWVLAALLRETPAAELGGAALARRFHETRRVDRGAVAGLTHGLVQLFSNDFAPAAMARGAVLGALAAVPPLKNFFARRMMLGARG